MKRAANTQALIQMSIYNALISPIRFTAQVFYCVFYLY